MFGGHGMWVLSSQRFYSMWCWNSSIGPFGVKLAYGPAAGRTDSSGFLHLIFLIRSMKNSVIQINRTSASFHHLLQCTAAPTSPLPCHGAAPTPTNKPPTVNQNRAEPVSVHGG